MVPLMPAMYLLEEGRGVSLEQVDSGLPGLFGVLGELVKGRGAFVSSTGQAQEDTLEGTTGQFRPDADRRQRTGEAYDLVCGEAELSTGSRNLVGDCNDFGFGRGRLHTDLGDCRAYLVEEVGSLVAGVEAVLQPAKGRGSVRGCHVGGRAELGHGLSERGDFRLGNTELTCNGCNVGELAKAQRDFLAELLEFVVEAPSGFLSQAVGTEYLGEVLLIAGGNSRGGHGDCEQGSREHSVASGYVEEDVPRVGQGIVEREAGVAGTFLCLRQTERGHGSAVLSGS